MSDNKHSVLFVCMGNICRSPAGETVLKHMVAEEGLAGEFHIESAGTIGYHEGGARDRRMEQAALNRGYRMGGTARRISKHDFDKFDLIVAMDRENLADILRLDTGKQFRDKVKLFSEFIPGSQQVDVPDPYYGGGDGFETVLDMMEAGCGNIIAFLRDTK